MESQIERGIESQIEQHAERVLSRVPSFIWDGERLPVPVEHIADSCFGLHVRDIDDLRLAPGVPELAATQRLSGLLLPALGEIWVNAAEAREWPPRRRFTIGHELGHWCLHRVEGAVWCRSQAVDPASGDAGDRAARSSNEHEANEFAAALLMPARLVRSHYERLRRSDRCFELLCAAFEASGAAMSRRLRPTV